MRLEAETVLGIDAAWTDGQPSGVALLQKAGERWECLRVAPSYATFCGQFGWSDEVHGAPIDVPRLIEVCRRLAAGAKPLVVAVDMPLATTPIEGRRRADTEVSRRFGHCKCAVHSPSAQRPGATGRRLHEGFVDSGYALGSTGARAMPVLLEVYPHVSLLGLTDRAERLPYKVGKTTTYWHGQPAAIRKRRVTDEWAAILASLHKDIDAIDLALPDPPEECSLQYLKRFEDAIDGLVCAWTAVQVLRDAATPLGDDTATIWVPTISLKFAKEPRAA